MIVKQLTEHHLEFLSFKGGCTCSSESMLITLVEITCHGSYGYVVINGMGRIYLS